MVVKNFPSVKFRHTENFVIDVFNIDDKLEIANNEHNRAHRSYKENILQILEHYYFPDLQAISKSIASKCRTCQKSKYDRKPKDQKIGDTPIPTGFGEIIHLDIFSTEGKLFMTCVDKFSKFAITKPILTKSIADITPHLIEVINTFNPKTLVTDNERSLCSETIKSLLNNLGIYHHKVPTLHSKSNGQVERFHSTLIEIARCLKTEDSTSELTELLLQATFKYNNTIHSVTGFRPTDVLRGQCPKLKEEIIRKLESCERKGHEYHNKKKTQKQFNKGEPALLKINPRIGSKIKQVYKEGEISEDLGSTAKLKDGRRVHKDNLKKLT